METPDMTGWLDADRLAYAAAIQQAEDAEAALADDYSEILGSPAQAAIAEQKARAERALAERKRLAREKTDRVTIERLRAQFGKKITFFQSKDGLIAVKHPSLNAQLALQERIENMSRKTDRIATIHDAVREHVVFPELSRVKEIEKNYPMIMSEVNEQLDSDMRGRDFSARPLD